MADRETSGSGLRWVLFQDEDGSVPVVDWLDDLPIQARAKVVVQMERFEAGWHRVRSADLVDLGHGLRALRTRHAGVTYSVLYFHFALLSIVAVGGATTSNRGALRAANDTVRRCKASFEADPRSRTIASGSSAARAMSSALRYIVDRCLGETFRALVDLEEAKASAEIAALVRQARARSGMTQRQLAERIGTGPSVICRLENGEYRGQGIRVLRRIALALGGRVEVRLVLESSEGELT